MGWQRIAKTEQGIEQFYPPRRYCDKIGLGYDYCIEICPEESNEFEAYAYFALDELVVLYEGLLPEGAILEYIEKLPEREPIEIPVFWKNPVLWVIRKAKVFSMQVELIQLNQALTADLFYSLAHYRNNDIDALNAREVMVQALKNRVKKIKLRLP